MKATTKPFGTIDCDKLSVHFNPKKHKVMLCYMGDITSSQHWILGFDAFAGKHIIGFVFQPAIGIVEWNAGNIKFGEKTTKRFIKAFQKVYGCEPLIAKNMMETFPRTKAKVFHENV